MRIPILMCVILVVGGAVWLTLGSNLSTPGETEQRAALANVERSALARPEESRSTNPQAERDSGAVASGSRETSSEVGIDPSQPALVDLLERIDRTALAEFEVRAVASLSVDPGNAELHVDLCEAARLLGHIDLAVKHGKRACKLLPEGSRAHHQYAKALGEQMREGGLLTAIKLVGTYKDKISEAIELDPRNFQARAEQIAFLLFMPSMGGGDKDRAAKLTKQLEQDDARWGLLMQVLLRVEKDDEPGAIEISEQGLQRFPGDQRIAVTLAGLLDDVNRQAEADAHYQMVLDGARSESYYAALFQRARMHIRAGNKLRESIDALQEFVSSEPYGEFLPSLSDAHYRMGSAWEQLGDDKVARREYKRTLELDPSNDKAGDALARL